MVLARVGRTLKKERDWEEECDVIRNVRDDDDAMERNAMDHPAMELTNHQSHPGTSKISTT